MTLELLFIVGMPALFAAFVYGMYRFDVGKTDWNPPPPAPHKEPTDREKVRLIGWFTLFGYVVLLISSGPFLAAILLAFLLTLLVGGAFIVTCIQEIVFWVKGPKLNPDTGAPIPRLPFRRRLLHNIFGSYEVLAYLTP